MPVSASGVISSTDVFSLVIEPGIKKSDATHVDGDKVTLMEMNFGELMLDPKGMKLIEQMEGKKPEEVAKLVEGIKGVQLAELGLQSWAERRWLDVPALK